MRSRLGTRVKPSRTCPLHLEWLEDRRVLSAVAAPLDSPPPTPAPQAATADVTSGSSVVASTDCNSQGQDNNQGQGNGKGQDNDQGNGGQNGLGGQVSTWTHEGIHGTQLAALIHQLQDQRNGGGPPTVNPGGPPVGLPGDPGGSGSGSSGSGGTVLGNPPPVTGSSGSTGSDSSDSSSGSARERLATALTSSQAAPTVSSHDSSSQEAAPVLSGPPNASANSAAGLAAAVNAAIFSQSSTESLFAPASASVAGTVVVSANTSSVGGNALALAVFTPGGHALNVSGASDVSLFPGVQEVSTQSLKQASLDSGPEGVQAARPAQSAAAAEGVQAAPVAAEAEADIVAAPVADVANLGDGFRSFFQRMQDVLSRLAKSPTFVALGSALVAAGGVLFEMRRRRRRSHRLKTAVPTLADPDSDLCLPNSGGSSSVSPS